MDTKIIADFKHAVFSAIDGFSLVDSSIHLNGWNNATVRILNMLIEEQMITKEEILNCIHKKIIDTGRTAYEQHQNGQYPDHTISPEALAYALYHGEFTDKERCSINYDHGDTEPSFVQEYNNKDKLKTSILNEMLKERESVPVNNNAWGDNCC